MDFVLANFWFDTKRFTDILIKYNSVKVARSLQLLFGRRLIETINWSNQTNQYIGLMTFSDNKNITKWTHWLPLEWVIFDREGTGTFLNGNSFWLSLSVTQIHCIVHSSFLRISKNIHRSSSTQKILACLAMQKMQNIFITDACLSVFVYYYHYAKLYRPWNTRWHIYSFSSIPFNSVCNSAHAP